MYDGKRGGNGGRDGWWVSIEEAREYVVGNEVWWHQAQKMEKRLSVKQYDPSGPPQRPIWMYSNGDMYLGEWKVSHPKPVENGFGATYTHCPYKYRGVVHVGEYKDGDYHGAGRAFWLESAHSWRKNELHATGIREKTQGGKSKSRPFMYIRD